jgi:hypothetical protein
MIGFGGGGLRIVRRICLLAIAGALGGLALGALLPPQAKAATYTDTYSGSGDWGTAANWSAGIPNSSAIVKWSTGNTVTISSADGSAFADSIQGGALSITGSNLYLASATDDSTVTGLSISGGDLSGATGQTLTVAGDIDWESATGSQGSINNSDGGQLAILQTGSHSCTIDGSGRDLLAGGSLSAGANPITISDSDFTGSGAGTASLSTSSTVSFSQSSYQNDWLGVTITAGGFVTSGAVSAPVFWLHLTGDLGEIAGGTLTVPALTTDPGSTLQIDPSAAVSVGGGTISGAVAGGTLIENGSSTATLDSNATWSGSLAVTAGTVMVTGSPTIGGLALSAGDLSGATGQTLTVAGDIDWESATGLQASINNSDGGQLAILQTGSHSCTIGGSGLDLFCNGSLDAGSNPITISAGDFTGPGGVTLATSSTVSFTQASYQNDWLGVTIEAGGFVTTGDVSAPAFFLHLTGDLGGIAGGTLTVPSLITDPGSTLQIGSGAALSTAGGTISGAVAGGTLIENGPQTMTLDSGATWSGSLAVTGGNVMVTGSPTIGGLVISDGDLSGATGQTLTVAGDVDLESAAGSQASIGNSDGGQLAILQTGSHSCTIDGSGCDLLANGSLDAGSSPITISDSDFIGPGGASLSTSSTVTFTQPSYQSDSLGLTITAGGFVTSGSVSAPVYALAQTGGTTTVPGSETLQAASFTLQGGTLQVDGTIEQAFGAIKIGGGLLTGSGTIDAPLLNSGGIVAPGDSGPGCLTVSNDYSQDSGGTLEIAADGSTSQQYSSLSVGGNVSLAGTLELVPNTSYQSAAQAGDRLVVLSYTGGLSGSFSGVSASPGFSAGYVVSASYGSGVADAVLCGRPTVSGASPQVGPLAGGTTVTISGSGFSGATAVDFGTTPAASFTVDSDSQITATAPAAASAGSVDITVTTAGGTSATGTADQFTYLAAPVVLDISPQVGPLAGGTTVTISGSGFSGATAVDFGTIPAASFAVDSDTEITAAAPAAASAGSVDITVTAAGGTSATGSVDSYGYAAAPTVSGISPATGSSAGGTSVTISGTALVGASTVDFGTTPATSFTVDSDTEITATAPAEAAGSVDVTVTTPGGTSATSAADQFTFETGPANTVLPELSGTGCVGRTITCSSGTWNGSPAPTLSYQWLRDGVAIGGASQNSYTVQIADCGHRLSCTVTATNAAGQASATSTSLLVAKPTVALRTSAAVVRLGRRVTLSGTVRNFATADRVVRIYRRLGTKLALLKSLTVSSSGAYRWTRKAKASGKWVFVASYKVGSLTVTSRAVTVTVRR